jgi:hypothetical protein
MLLHVPHIGSNRTYTAPRRQIARRATVARNIIIATQIVQGRVINMELQAPSPALLIGSGRISIVQQRTLALTLVQNSTIAIRVIAARNTIIAKRVRRILRMLARAIGLARTFTVQELLRAVAVIAAIPLGILVQASCPRASRRIAAHITSIVTRVGLR